MLGSGSGMTASDERGHSAWTRQFLVSATRISGSGCCSGGKSRMYLKGIAHTARGEWY